MHAEPNTHLKPPNPELPAKLLVRARKQEYFLERFYKVAGHDMGGPGNNSKPTLDFNVGATQACGLYWAVEPPPLFWVMAGLCDRVICAESWILDSTCRRFLGLPGRDSRVHSNFSTCGLLDYAGPLILLWRHIQTTNTKSETSVYTVFRPPVK